jgi:ATP-dependent RNA helicase DeaD
MATETTARSFEALGLSDETLKALGEIGFEEPTPIQLQAIPPLLAGRDMMAQAQTGTGKTAAFGLPIVERLSGQTRGPEALILAPTRELAVQVAEAVHRFGKYRDTTVVAVYGGQPIDRQLRALSRPVDVVVGTPGRLMDHMRRETLKLDNVRFVVLDEADEMLDMGFIEDIETILSALPEARQTALFSATLPKRITDLASSYLKNPETIRVEPEQVSVPQITQTYYEVVQRAKLEALTRILDIEEPTSAMIFCRTKVETDEVTQALQGRGYAAEAIHGDLSQMMRDRVMNRFRAGTATLLVATDVAARGLDVEHVSHVINYSLPGDPESYVHRIGRTGRAGRSGEAISLVTPRERRLLRWIERAVGQRMEPRRVPTASDVAQAQRERLAATIGEIIELEEDLERPMAFVDELAAYYDPSLIAAAALSLLLEPEPEEPDIPVTAFGAERGMSRLFINIGGKDGLRPSDVVGAIANEAQIPGKAIGVIEIKDTYSFVEIPDHLAERVVNAIQGSRIRNREVRVEIARPRDSSDGSRDRQAGDRRDSSSRDGHPPRRDGGRDSRPRKEGNRPRRER